MNTALKIYNKVKNDDNVIPFEEAVENEGKYSTPYPIGFKEFDDSMLGGIREGDLFVGTGLSGCGKTTLFQNISVNMSKRGFPSLWLSYEVSVNNLYAKFKEMGATEKNFFLYIPKQNTSGNIDWIEEKIDESLKKYSTKIIFVDHIDFLAPRKMKSSDQRRMVLKDICMELKEIAIRKKVAIFLIAHVKKVFGREIEMQDLSESAGIYQLADFVVCIDRNAKSHKGGNGKKFEVAENGGRIRMLKNRITGECPYIPFIMEKSIIMPACAENDFPTEDDKKTDITVVEEEDGKESYWMD